jgi:hypothetical protein
MRSGTVRNPHVAALMTDTMTGTSSRAMPMKSVAASTQLAWFAASANPVTWLRVPNRP